MATRRPCTDAFLSSSQPQRVGWNGGQLALDALQLCEPYFQRSSSGPDWTATPECLLLHIGRYLDSYAISNARSVCKLWRHAFSLNVRSARLEVVEHRAAPARAFLRAFIRAFPSTTELVLDVTFRRTAREKIQAALEEHFQALHDFGLQALQLNLDLNSFNERKIKLPDVALLAYWSGLTRLTLQESGWRSQQLRVDAGSVFGCLPALQELAVVCKYSGAVKAQWWRPPSPAERAAARMPTWPPAAGAAAAAAAAAGGRGGGGGGSSSLPVCCGSGCDATMEDVATSSGQHGGGMLLPTPPLTLLQASQQQHQHFVASSSALSSSATVAAAAAAPPRAAAAPRPVLTQHLRCQLTQNQSMSGELQKALRRITPALQAHVSALTFEIVEETYAEPARCATPLELSALPGLKSLTVLSGAEDALSHSKLDIVGATALESLVVFDVSCGCWCYKKPGHGISPRLLSAPPACLRSLTVVGFVVNQCTNLHALSALPCLEELRLEQPDPDCLAAVAGELLLTWLPPSLKTLKLHAVVLPPCGGLLPSAAAGGAAGAAGAATGTAAAAAVSQPLSFGSTGAAVLAAGAAAAGCSSSSSEEAALTGAAELLYGVAPLAPLPRLRELYLSKCKLPTLGVLGVCSQLTALGLINCLSCSGLLPAAAALPALRSLALIHTLSAEQEHGPSCTGGAVGGGLPTMPQAIHVPAAAAAPAPAAASEGRGAMAWGLSAASAAAAGPPVLAPSVHVPGLPLPAAVWGSDEQVAAAAACRTVTSLELILPRGTAGYPAVAAVARMPCVRELDVALPCGLSECLMGLAALGRGAAGGGGGGRLRRLTLWVDSRTCVSRTRARQLQAIQRSLQAHMPDTLVEWAGAESRHSSWTGLEARVFSPH